MAVSGTLTPDFNAKEKSNLRMMIAAILVGLLPVTVLSAYVALFTGYWSDAKDLLQIVLPVRTAFLGSVIGFYFGSQKNM